MTDIKFEITCKQRTLSGKIEISKIFLNFIPFVCSLFVIYQMCINLYYISDVGTVVGVTFPFLVRLLLIALLEAAAGILLYFMFKNSFSFINKHKYCIILIMAVAVFLLQGHTFLAECPTMEDLLESSVSQFVSFLMCAVIGFSAYTVFHKHLKSRYVPN